MSENKGTNTTRQEINALHVFPGSLNGDMGQSVGAFSQERVQFPSTGEDPGFSTHQLDVLAADIVDMDDMANRVSAASENIAQRITNPELIALRSQHPFVDIVPLPTKSLFVVASQNNDVREVRLPDHTQMIRFCANNIDFFVQMQGVCQMPPPEEVTNGNGALYAPINQWYYVKGLRSLSIGLALANSGVSILCYVQN